MHTHIYYILHVYKYYLFLSEYALSRHSMISNVHLPEDIDATATNATQSHSTGRIHNNVS